mgnify:CR=1 FL=1
MPYPESEKITRKKRIDAQLKKLGWKIIPYETGLNTSALGRHAVEEYPTSNGPADYGLFVNGKLLGITEAKKHGIGAQNVLEQAKRYARGVVHNVGRWGEYMVPFLFSSSGEQVWFLDVRHPQNISRPIREFYTPDALWEFFHRDEALSSVWFRETPIDNPRLRPYQKKAIAATEEAVIDGKRKMLLAMATGTGKTFTTVNQIYRLLKSKKAKRILFLVDRKALAAQAATAFAAFETPSGLKLNQEYELYSQRFKKEDLEEGEKFDVNVLPNEYLTKPDASKTFVHICTIQRMAINLLGKDAVMGDADNDNDDESDADKLDIPIHAFDVIIADECHRGYTSKESNVWRTVLEYFDAIKIGLTATPALHTVSYFNEPVYRYTVNEAILDGFLVGYDAVKIKSGVLMNGVFLKEGEQVGKLDTLSGQLRIEGLEDERQFDASQVERKITVPDTNRKIILELKKYCNLFEEENGRFPKTLIFASNDINNISHADALVNFCKETFNRGDDFVAKITGNPNVDRPLEKIRKFRNRPEPKIVVSVDMLSTGVDIPSLEFIVFLRPVKSRILWEQMLGRGTRLCTDINKEKFTVFDCFDGTLIEYFKNVTNFDDLTADPIPVTEIIRRINDNEDRDHNVNVFVKRLRRIEKRINSEGRKEFEKYITEGDIGKFADNFKQSIEYDFSSTMKILNDKGFQKLLVNYKRSRIPFIVAQSKVDTVESQMVFEVEEKLLKPAEYLDAFAEFIKSNKEKIEAVKILLEKPKDWKTEVLKTLRSDLLKNHFPESSLKRATQLVHKKHLPDIISIIKKAAKNEPLLEVNERVDKAIQTLFSGKELTAEQSEWIQYIKEHLIQNLTLDKEDFEYSPILERHGGWGRFKKVFSTDAETIIIKINEAIAA